MWGIVKVLVINGGPRRHGVTSTLLAELARLIGDKHEVQVVRVHDLVMRPCQGCLKCRPDKPCVLPRDDANMLADAVKTADLLVLGSPVYWGNIPGPLKIFSIATSRSSSTARPSHGSSPDRA